MPTGAWVYEAIHLQTKAGEPRLSTQNTLVKFGTVALNRSATQTVTLENEGDVSLVWRVKVPEDVSSFVIVSPETGEIPPMGISRVTVTFTALTLDDLHSVLTFSSAGGVVQVVCSGHVLVPQLQVPEVCLTCAALTFFPLVVFLP